MDVIPPIVKHARADKNPLANGDRPWVQIFSSGASLKAPRG
jgi:hypothetical protein